jgi:hypothetical protein
MSRSVWLLRGGYWSGGFKGILKDFLRGFSEDQLDTLKLFYGFFQSGKKNHLFLLFPEEDNKIVAETSISMYLTWRLRRHRRETKKPLNLH